MDEPQSLTPPDRPPKRRRWVFRLGLAAALSLLAFVVFCSLTSSDTKRIICYSPDEFARAIKLGSFAKIKIKASHWLELLLHHSKKPKTISIDSHAFQLPATKAGIADLGPPVSTNADGMRLWILPSEKLQPLDIKLTWAATHMSSIIAEGYISDASISVVSQIEPNGDDAIIYLKWPQIRTYEDIRSLPMFSFVPSGTGQKQTGSWLAVFNPRITADSIRLTICAASTNLITDPTGGQIITTNFFAACRVQVPNDSGVVIDAGNSRNTNDDHWWIIISPKRVDPPSKPK